MAHLGEETLVALHYGDADAAAREHLEACPECREALLALSRDLDAVTDDVAEPGPEFEERMWAAVRPRLHGGRLLSFRPPRALAWTALAASLIAAFAVGRYSAAPVTAPPATAASEDGPVRERVLLVAVGDHLERSAVLLVELSNTGSAEGARADLADARGSAATLLAANRLYRQSAGYAGDPAVESVLGELERVLAEIAHAPADGGAAELAQLRKRIEKREILFKVRVLGTKVRDQERKAIPAGARAL